MVETPDPYVISPTGSSVDQLAQYAALLSAVFPTSTRYTFDYLRWQYVENPDGGVVGYDAYAGDELAAHYVTIPIRASLGGIVMNGVLSLNTATHTAHQGKGLFTRLASATYEAAAAKGYRFVVGVANANSTPGFLRKLGFHLIAPLDARVGIGRPVRQPECGFERTWSVEAAAWRVRDPSADYRRGGTSLYADPSLPLIRMVVASSFEPGGRSDPSFFIGRPLTGWIGLGCSWRGIALPVPSSMRPSPLNLIFKPLGDDVPVPTADSSRFEAIDFDAY